MTESASQLVTVPLFDWSMEAWITTIIDRVKRSIWPCLWISYYCWTPLWNFEAIAITICKSSLGLIEIRVPRRCSEAFPVVADWPICCCLSSCLMWWPSLIVCYRLAWLGVRHCYMQCLIFAWWWEVNYLWIITRLIGPWDFWLWSGETRLWVAIQSHRF